MIVTTSWIEYNYNKFNKLYFGNTLPNISFKTSNTKKAWGYATYKYDFINSTIIPLSITISNYYDSPEDVKIQTLLHEMIHIEDYFWHPEHFIRNGKKVSGNYYNAHGSWFKNEANRITKESGYKITNHVSREDVGRSCLSVHAQKLLDNKIKDARIIVVSNNISYWIFKTDIYKINTVINLIKNQFPNMKKITEYTTNNSSLASFRSCNTRLSGWCYSKQGMMNFAEKYQFTTIRSYSIK